MFLESTAGKPRGNLGHSLYFYEDEETDSAIRKAPNSGRPFGSETFVDLLELRLNQVLKPKKLGVLKRKRGSVRSFPLLFWVHHIERTKNGIARSGPAFCVSHSRLLKIIALEISWDNSIRADSFAIFSGRLEQNTFKRWNMSRDWLAVMNLFASSNSEKLHIKKATKMVAFFMCQFVSILAFSAKP